MVLNLLNNKAIKVLKDQLIKKVDLITPNIPEAEVLTNIKIKNLNDMIKAGKYFNKIWCQKRFTKRGSYNIKTN